MSAEGFRSAKPDEPSTAARTTVTSNGGRFHLLQALSLVWQSAPGVTLLSMCVVTAQALVPLVPLYVVRLIVNTITEGVTSFPGSNAWLETTGARVLGLIAIAAGATIVSMILKSAALYVREMQAHTLGDFIQSRIHAKSIDVPLTYYERPAFFDALHRAQEEAPFRPTQVVDELMLLLRTGLSLAGIAVILIAVLPWYGLPALLVASLPLVLARVLHSRRHYRWRMRRTSAERHVVYLNWLLTGREHAKELRLFGLGRLLARRSAEKRNELRGERLALAAARSKGEAIAYSLQTLVVFAVVAVVALAALRGETTLGDFVLLLQAVQKGQALASELSGAVNGLYESNLFLATVFEFLRLPTDDGAANTRTPADEPESGAATSTRSTRGSNAHNAARVRPAPLTLRDVSFSYPGTDRLVLDRVSLSMGPGELVALVGDNGAGKSTLMKLACGFYEPDRGTIRYGDTPLSGIPKDLWWNSITALFQDYAQYHYTAEENLWFGRSDRPPDRTALDAAADSACAGSFIASLPSGWKTQLGRFLEEGIEPSGGQWKKLALARTFYRDSSFAILDEPTSGLDPDSEARLLATIRLWAEHRSVLLVTHRAAAARMADRIYVMRDGRITEEGTHEELCARGGLYETMYRMQLNQLQGVPV